MSREYRRVNSNRIWIRPHPAPVGAEPVMEVARSRSRSRSPSPRVQPAEIVEQLVPLDVLPILNELPPMRVIPPGIAVNITEDQPGVYTVSLNPTRELGTVEITGHEQIENNPLRMNVMYKSNNRRLKLIIPPDQTQDKFFKITSTIEDAFPPVVINGIINIRQVHTWDFLITIRTADHLYELDDSIGPTPGEINEINARIEHFNNLRYPQLTSSGDKIRVGLVPPPTRNRLITSDSFFKEKREFDRSIQYLNDADIPEAIENFRRMWKAHEIDPGYSSAPNFNDCNELYHRYLVGEPAVLTNRSECKLSKIAFIGISEGNKKFLSKVVLHGDQFSIRQTVSDGQVATLTAKQSQKIRTGTELFFTNGLDRVVKRFYQERYWNTPANGRVPRFEAFLRDVADDVSNRELYERHGIIIPSDLLSDKIQWCRLNRTLLTNVFRGGKTEKQWADELKVLIPNQGDYEVYRQFEAKTYRGFFIPLEAERFMDPANALDPELVAEYFASGEDAEDALNNGTTIAFAQDGKYFYDEPNVMGRNLTRADEEMIRVDYSRPWDRERRGWREEVDEQGNPLPNPILANSLPAELVDRLLTTNDGWSFAQYYDFSIPIDADDRQELLNTVRGQYQELLDAISDHRRRVASLGTDIQDILDAYNPLPDDQKDLIIKFFHAMIILALRARQWTGKGPLPMFGNDIPRQRPDETLDVQLSALMVVPRDYINQMSQSAKNVLNLTKTKTYGENGSIQTGSSSILLRFNVLQGYEATDWTYGRCMQLGSNQLVATSVPFLQNIVQQPFMLRNNVPYRNIFYNIKAPDEEDDVTYDPEAPEHPEGDQVSLGELVPFDGPEWYDWGQRTRGQYYNQINPDYDHEGEH